MENILCVGGSLKVQPPDQGFSRIAIFRRTNLPIAILTRSPGFDLLRLDTLATISPFVSVTLKPESITANAILMCVKAPA